MRNQGKPIYVLGTHLSHDGSACLLKDGRICVAIEKERITRRKHAGGNDTDAIKYCLDFEGISVRDLDLVVQNANFGMVEQGNSWWGGPRVFDENVPMVTISHHLAHAYSAIGTAPFDEMTVLTIDGCGNSMDDCIDVDQGVALENPPAHLRHLYFEKDSYYQFAGNKLTTVVKDFSEWGTGIKGYPMHPTTTRHSIGGLYLAASMYVFSGFEDPGKLMGLAPYGMAGVYDFAMFDLKDGRAFVRYDWMSEFKKPCHSWTELKANFQYYADIAYWVQKEVERAILYVINARYDACPSENLAYTGGVALNAVANARIIKETKFKNLYIQPAAADKASRSDVPTTAGWKSSRKNASNTAARCISERATQPSLTCCRNTKEKCGAHRLPITSRRPRNSWPKEKPLVGSRTELSLVQERWDIAVFSPIRGKRRCVISSTRGSSFVKTFVLSLLRCWKKIAQSILIVTTTVRT